MKTNGVMDGSDSPGLKSDPRIHTAWANYFVKFIQAYEQRGINFWGLTPQNEPLFAAPWEACVYSGREEGEFVVNYLGPALDAAHLDHLNLMIYDHNRGHLPQFVRDFMAVPGAEKYVAGIAFHWYDNQSFAAVAEVHDEYPQHFVLGTEACNCPGVQVGSWSRGESYGFDIIGDLLAGASGWVDWNLILDLQGGPNHLNNYCDAGIIVNNTDNADISYFLQPSYFFMGHFSRFFRPNDTVIESSWDGVVNQLYCVSTRSHHRNSRAPLATVCMNQADSEEEFALTDGEEYLDVKLPPHSIASITWGTD
jgi:glucosylceramidase